MIGIYTFSCLVLAGMVTLIVFKVKWARADRQLEYVRAARIEEQRLKE